MACCIGCLLMAGLSACAPANGRGIEPPKPAAPLSGQLTASSLQSGVGDKAQGGNDSVSQAGTARVSARQIPNFHLVHPFLVRGAAPTPEGLETLRDMGVRTVIDLRISPKRVAAERRQVEQLGMRFINLPMSGDPPTTAQVRTFLQAVSDPAQRPVFVHCQHGADRTGTMVGIYREQMDHWSFDEAYKEMRRFGFDPHWRKLTMTVRQYASK